MSTDPSISDGELDATPYIRTFAQDFAALSGKNPEEIEDDNAPKEKHPKHKKPKKSTHEEPAILGNQNDSLLVHTQPNVAPLDLPGFEQKVSQVEQPEPEESVQEMAAAAQSEVPEPISLPRIDPGDIVPQETDADRAGILARLKARALENTKDSVDHTLAPIIPTATVEPIPSPVEESPSPIHTYSSDFVDHVAEEHASPFSILAAEKDAETPAPTPKKKGNNTILIIVTGVVLVVAGIGSLTAAFLYMKQNAPVLTIPLQPTLISVDSRTLLSGSGSDLLQSLAQQAEQPLPNDNVELTYVNESTTTSQGVTEAPASGGAFIAELGLQAPDILLRNIDPSSMVGIVSANGETRPFFILRVSSYERTFAGMLQWEPTLFSQLSVLYPEYPVPLVRTQTVSTSTASTTKATASSTVLFSTPTINPAAPALQFTDETVASHDTRVLKDNSGRTLVLYGYADKQTLIIARNEAAFTILLNRLSAGAN